MLKKLPKLPFNRSFIVGSSSPTKLWLLLAGFSILLVYALLLLFSDKSGFKKKTGNEKIQIVSGLLACLLIITGCVFKLMNYHGGNALLLSGFTFLIILFLPALFYGLYKRPVNK